MKELFPGYYQPSEAEFAELWKNGTFVFDANVLLDVYRYTAETRDSLLSALQALRGRRWIPYQVAEEFQRNRVTVIAGRLNVIKQVDDAFEAAEKKIGELLPVRRNPFLNRDHILGPLGDLRKKAAGDLTASAEGYGHLLNEDWIHERLAALFQGAVGPPSPTAGTCAGRVTLSDHHEAAKIRFQAKMPPGYLDASGDKKKPEPACYGDFVLWAQTLEWVREKPGPVVFVTGDEGEDWFQEVAGKKLGPRPELIQELRLAAGGAVCWLYSTESFLHYAETYLRIAVSAGAVEEIRDVSASREQTDAPAVGVRRIFGLWAPVVRSVLDMGMLTRDSSGDIVVTESFHALGKATDAFNELAALTTREAADPSSISPEDVLQARMLALKVRHRLLTLDSRKSE